MTSTKVGTVDYISICPPRWHQFPLRILAGTAIKQPVLLPTLTLGIHSMESTKNIIIFSLGQNQFRIQELENAIITDVALGDRDRHPLS